MFPPFSRVGASMVDFALRLAQLSPPYPNSRPSQIGEFPPGKVQAGDVVRVFVPAAGTDPARVVSNDVAVQRVDATGLYGYVGAVTRANGQFASWWNDAARIRAGQQLGAVRYPRLQVQHVWRNGRMIA